MLVMIKVFWLKLERVADVRAKKTGVKQDRLTDFREMKSDEKEENCIMVIQVPLIQDRPATRGYSGGYLMTMSDGSSGIKKSKTFYSDCTLESCCVGSEEDWEELECKSERLPSRTVKETGLDMGNVQVGSRVDKKDRDEDDKYVYPDNAKNFKLRRDPAYPVRVTF